MTDQVHTKSLGQRLAYGLIASPVLLIGLAIMAFLACEANKAYWDFRVRQMCEEDGGITVFERVSPPSKYTRPDGTIVIPPLPNPNDRPPFRWEAHPDDTFYRISEHKILKDGFITIRRHSEKIVSSSTKKILGEAVVYGRGGGDFPIGINHGSSFLCPKALDLGRAVFIPPNSNDNIEEK